MKLILITLLLLFSNFAFADKHLKNHRKIEVMKNLDLSPMQKREVKRIHDKYSRLMKEKKIKLRETQKELREELHSTKRGPKFHKRVWNLVEKKNKIRSRITTLKTKKILETRHLLNDKQLKKFNKHKKEFQKKFLKRRKLDRFSDNFKIPATILNEVVIMHNNKTETKIKVRVEKDIFKKGKRIIKKGTVITGNVIGIDPNLGIFNIIFEDYIKENGFKGEGYSASGSYGVKGIKMAKNGKFLFGAYYTAFNSDFKEINRYIKVDRDYPEYRMPQDYYFIPKGAPFIIQ